MTKSQAVQHFGSVSALAQALGVTYEAVRQWDEVPELRQYQLQHMTGGQLMADHRPTVAQNLRGIEQKQQTVNSAGNLSSIQQASA